jgi:hypothetical protein
MTHAHLGVLPHKSREFRHKNHKHFNSVHLPVASPSAIHLEKSIPNFQPFDLFRHSNHLSLPRNHSLPITAIAHVPDLPGGFWGARNGLDG